MTGLRPAVLVRVLLPVRPATAAVTARLALGWADVAISLAVTGIAATLTLVLSMHLEARGPPPCLADAAICPWPVMLCELTLADVRLGGVDQRLLAGDIARTSRP